jgi:hypothetical protein
MAIRFIASALIGLWLCGAAAAGQLQDLARQAEAKAQAGQYTEAIAAIREALYELWGKSPLQFRRAFFVTQKATGFGIFNRRKSNIFKPGEPLLLYAEPIGYGWKQDGQVYKSDIIADFDLRDSKGKILTGQKDFGAFRIDSYDRNTEYFVNMTYKLTGLSAGKFIIGTTLRDKITGKSGSFDLPFEVK